jgi:hypothetical protein
MYFHGEVTGSSPVRSTDDGDRSSVQGHVPKREAKGQEVQGWNREASPSKD